MSTPGKGKEYIIAMYDNYAKTVMRNQCRNAIKSKSRRQKRETPGTESMQYLFEMQPHTDIYSSEHVKAATDEDVVDKLKNLKGYSSRGLCLRTENLPRTTSTGICTG